MPRRTVVVITLVVLSVAMFMYFISTTTRQADLLLTNGVIYTLNAEQPRAEAMAIRGNKIIAVGKVEDLRASISPKQEIDLKSQTVVPGFIDGHAHLDGLGRLMQSILLYGIKSPEEILALVKERAAATEPGKFIIGRGWDQNLWEGKLFPTAAGLDAVASAHPVILIRVDGHASWVNSVAMKMAGISRDTRDPEGGKIIRDAAGNPTGVFLDNARDLVEDIIPPETPQEVEQILIRAAEECVKAGITEVHHMGVEQDMIDAYRKLIDEQRLPLRIYAAISLPSATWDIWKTKEPLINYGNGMLTVRATKMYIDGALGSRGAALIEQYSDDPGNRGITISSESKLIEGFRETMKGGFQPCAHAIGDRANHMALNAFEKVAREFPDKDYRGRIEHAQVVDPNDIPRFQQLHILPSMQPVHATSDMYWAEARLGPSRLKGAYAWHSFINNGSIIVGGSDFPNDDMHPLSGFYAAITRSDQKGYPADGWTRSERMSREEALRSFTAWPAFGAFEEDLKGTIEVGKWADLTILSKDIMSVPPQEILSTEVVMTLVGGKIVFQKEPSPVAQ